MGKKDKKDQKTQKPPRTYQTYIPQQQHLPQHHHPIHTPSQRVILIQHYMF